MQPGKPYPATFRILQHYQSGRPTLFAPVPAETPIDRYKNEPGWIRTIALLDVAQTSSPLDHGIMK